MIEQVLSILETRAERERRLSRMTKYRDAVTAIEHLAACRALEAAAYEIRTKGEQWERDEILAATP